MNSCNSKWQVLRLSPLFQVLFHYPFGHADGTCRADQPAKVAAHTLSAYQTGTAGLAVEDDGLMAAVTT